MKLHDVCFMFVILACYFGIVKTSTPTVQNGNLLGPSTIQSKLMTPTSFQVLELNSITPNTMPTSAFNVPDSTSIEMSMAEFMAQPILLLMDNNSHELIGTMSMVQSNSGNDNYGEDINSYDNLSINYSSQTNMEIIGNIIMDIVMYDNKGNFITTLAQSIEICMLQDMSERDNMKVSYRICNSNYLIFCRLYV